MRYLLYTIALLFATCAYGQELYWQQPAKFITEFHFKQLSGGIVLLKAQFNNIPDSFNFILDTGSSGISLDSATAEKYDIPQIPSGRYIYGIAGVRKVNFSPNNNLSFPGLKVDSMDFYINDYDILSSVYGIKIDGIIGFSLLSRYIVKVNYDSLKVSIFTPGFIRYPSHGYLLHPRIRGIPVVPLAVRDSRNIHSDFYFDTGAGLCFMISKQFKDDSSALSKKRRPKPVEVQGLGGARKMKISIVKSVQIGNYKFKRVPTYILDDEYNVISYPSQSGLIGSDILRRFNIIINYPQREIHLLPNNHFNELFDLSYTGMTLYLIEGQVVIDGIIEGSPADKAGLKNGDVIMSVNNNFSHDIEVYKNLLQRTSEKITIIVTRDGAPVIISLRVGRIR